MAEAVGVMVHVIEARDLKPQNSSMMLDPILSIEVLGEKRFTPKFTKDLAPYFNHYFQVESDKVRDFASETLLISVFDTGTLFRKELIGSFAFELAEVHKRPNHEYFRVWTLLTSQDKTGKSQVRGYLRLSVTVLRPGDVPVQHDEPDDDTTDGEEEDLSKMVLLKPAGMDGIDNVLRVKLLRAENLPKMDAIGSVDPLIEVKFGTAKNRTSTVKGNYNPTWNEELQLPVILPTVADNVFVKIMDFDGVGKDELIAQRTVSLKEIQTPTGKNWGVPGWINLYWKKGSQGEFQDYAGRVLASFSVLQAEAKIGVVKTGGEPEPPTTPYSIAFDLFEVQGLKKAEYYVVVQIGNQKVQSSKRKGLSEKEHAGGLVEFYENVPDLDVVFPQDTSQVPDIFVYVYEDVPGDDKRIGYLRYTYAQFSKLGPNPRWETLKRKTSESKDDENFNVSIQFKASIGPQKQARTKIVKPPKKFFQLRAHIYLGANLPAGDEDALSDPYLTVSLGGARGKTKVHEHTIYPDWYETVVLDVELPEAYPPDIQLSVFDYDNISSDEFLGRVSVPLPKPTSAQAVPEPQWFRLSMREQVPGRGEILASFQLFPQESKNVPLPNIRPPTIDAEIELGIIGLKELAPFRLLPVSNPYIKFSVGGSKHAAQTRVAKGSKGNANFFENVKINAQLPENGMFIPALLVEVFDKRPIKDVMVGTTSIPLSSFAPWVPQDKKAPVDKYVELPPVVNDEQFYQPQSVEPLPGPPAAEIKQDQQQQVIIQIDEPKTTDESQSLLDKGKGKGTDTSLKEIGVRREIPTTTVPGMEDEPEPPQPPQLPTEVEHNLHRFPFVELDLFRGTSQGVSSGNLLNRPDAVSGKLKGSIAIRSSKGAGSSKKQEQVVDVTQIAKNRPYVLRVYIETGHNLVPHDDNGYSDPYLVLSTGRQVIKDKENVKEKTLQPEYYKMYTFRGNLPEENQLKVQLYDKDTIGSDEFMGETKYDLEMLWFSDEWRKLNPKPKEFRTLWSSLSSFPQGKLKMWIELLTPEEAAVQEPYPIAPPRKEPFELRIIVWETKNVVPKDKILGKDSSDQFVVTKLLNHAQTQQQTDVHNSVMDGCGKFNWRIIYEDLLLPYDVPRLKVQVYDKDHIGPNDSIAEANLNLKGFFQKGLRNGSAKIGILTNVNNLANQTLQITNTSKEGSNTAGPYNSGQWLDLFHPAFEGVQGTICLELELLTREEALKKTAGRGRGEPNQNPFLPEPVRPKREWFSDLFKFLGLDKIKKYLIMAGIILAIVLVLFIVLYFAL